MTYRGEVIPYRAPLGIKPTPEDHLKVRAWSIMGIGTRQIGIHLGERFGLGKPMSMCSLYYHFRDDLVFRKRGRHVLTKTLKAQVMKNIAAEMTRMIAEARRGKEKK